jgi:outer membrane protein assembly factor BamB
MKTRAILAVAVCVLGLSARADDWPQFRGPNRDNVSKETGLLKEWPAAGPKLLWTYNNAGSGYSCPAIVGDTLYTMGARGADEYVFALNLTANPPAEKWAAKIGPTFTWKNNQWNKGPSATPTVAGKLVFALGAQGDLVCVDTAGKEVWRKSFPKDLKGEVNPVGGGPPKIGWGYAGSPLVDGDNLICVPGGPGGLVAALNKDTGDVVWRSKDLVVQATYSSPIISNAGGVKQYVVMTEDGAAGVAAKDGALLWNYKRDEAFGDIVAPTPVVSGDSVFITAAPSGGRDLLKLAADGGKFKAEAIVSDNKLENHHGGVVLVEGYVYGCSRETRSRWFCMDFKSGKIVWELEERKVGKGSVTYADGRLYCLSDKGVVALADVSPTKKFEVASSFNLPAASPDRPQRGGVWTHPVVANGKLYLRDQELLFCYDVKGN